MKQTPVIRTQADLHRTWTTLMSPLGFGTRSLWLMLLEPDGEARSPLVEIAELPDLPDGTVDGLGQLLRHFADDSPGLRLAVLLTRAGPGGPTPGDSAWAAAVYAACREAGVPGETVHLATSTAVVPLTMDDLPATG